MKYRHILATVAASLSGLLPSAALAQQFDPRMPLSQVISAFQVCGPPQVYQMLSPQLFMLVAQQTQGRGCYAQIAQAGPVTGMQVLAQQQFPTGPLFIVRVSHQAGNVVDWFIGFNQYNGKIESLTFQAAQAQPPTIPGGPTPEGGGSPGGGTSTGGSTGGGTGAGSGGTGSGSSGGDGCDLYPAMC